MNIITKNTEITTENTENTAENTAENFVAETEAEIVEEPQPLYCNYVGCTWATHKNAKDKERGLKNHQKKCKFRPINFIESKKQTETDFVKTESVEKNKSDKDDEEYRQELLATLDLMKAKFPHIQFDWKYNNTSSINILKRQKTLFLRIISDSAATESIFQIMVIGSRALEKVGDMSGAVDLNGYSKDINDNHDQIFPILSEMVNTGQISVKALTPEIRLAMVMSSIAINRIENNKIINLNELRQSEQEGG